MNIRSIFTILFLALAYLGNAQWYDPSEYLEGQAWPDETKSTYDRLPARAEGSVAGDVWGNSLRSAGLMVRFRSNAKNIVIRYGVSDKNFGMNHMPATGKSGVDLYAIDSDGKELWCAGRRSFSDTIVYRFNHLNPNDRYHKKGREYRLYLPLYNHVEWMEIGVDDGDYFEFVSPRPEKPIVVYGTSIAQGACALRPGMAWTAIVGRAMDRPLINLGFSGSGRLEQPVLDLIAEIDAKVYVLDCLPNLSLTAWEKYKIKSDQDLIDRVLNAVRFLKSKHPETPVLLVEHAGYTEAGVSEKREKDYAVVNDLQEEAFRQLKEEGVQGLFYLTKEDIGLSVDAMVDGVHPTDLGMMQYAVAYEKKLRSILAEPTGFFSTTLPITQYREPGNYDWEKRHLEILALNKSNPPKQVIIANSIVHYWGGKPAANMARDSESWDKIFTPAGLRNMAYGWDRIENVLWRVYHGELDGFEAKRVLVMIGTNNIHLNSDEEIIAGLDLLVEAIKNRQPKAEIVLMGLLPRRDYVERIQALNLEIARLSEKHRIKYDYLGNVFVDDDGNLKEELFSDGLHPNLEGYQKMSGHLANIVKQ
ncbi:SGNH/GDSL hydrolase family protein [Portibacter lacus]|uniref:Acetylhydrolase n=1 Tax=Portibacter lacus TaxID=1099794 RepID=A0AA37SXT4_9BACT|nr:SGNH/GDSL hydrolase family protein [Portibacter lacus]GLR19790.1 acetylhydrolase [Portibacter lacus]